MNIEIKSLSTETLDDFLFFFDNIVFCDHPDWSVCYCYSFHFVGSGEEWNNKEKNRSSVINLINKGHMKGYLAYIDGKPVAWCNSNDKNNYERLKLSKELWGNKSFKICSVVCFLVAPKERGKGLATKLLERVCKDYKDLGYDYIESYPKKGKATDEEQFIGPAVMYKKSGFVIKKEFNDYIIMQKKLN
jgi:GNAT superfamily N-acetyltransferase